LCIWDWRWNSGFNIKEKEKSLKRSPSLTPTIEGAIKTGAHLVSSTSQSARGRETPTKYFVYDLTSDPDQFIKTTKKITNFVGRNYKEYTADLTEAVKALNLIMPTARLTRPHTTNGVRTLEVTNQRTYAQDKSLLRF
jgi:hypothetical protein